MHFDCYCRANSNPIKVKTLSDVPKATIDLRDTSPEFDPLTYTTATSSKPIFMTFEVFHPLSTNLISRIERILTLLEHTTTKHQVAFTSFSSKNPPLFEPNLLVLPLSEFRVVLTLHASSQRDQPFVFEFWVDFNRFEGSTGRTPFQITFVFPPFSPLSSPFSLIGQHTKQTSLRSRSTLRSSLRNCLTTQLQISQFPWFIHTTTTFRTWNNSNQFCK